MKLVIASDIHGSAFWCRKLMDVVASEQPDYLVLLGDLLYHGPRNDLPREYAPKQVIEMLHSEASFASGEIAKQRSTRWFCRFPAWPIMRCWKRTVCVCT